MKEGLTFSEISLILQFHHGRARPSTQNRFERPPMTVMEADPKAGHAAAFAAPNSDAAWTLLGHGVTINPRALNERSRGLLTPAAVELLSMLHRSLGRRRHELLAERAERQAAWDAGALPDYERRDSPAVAGDWRVAPIPADLRCRRVEITGPASDPKMVINMLSRSDSGDRADTAMLDLEDSMKPTWANVVAGIDNIVKAVRHELEFVRPGVAGGPPRVYRLDPSDMAKVMVRVRGLHLAESNVRVDGEAVAGGFFDLALCLAHTLRLQLERGETPKVYVPKTEHFLEARLWNDAFVLVQEKLGAARGSLRATFLIETLPAAFQMEEILYELREHAAGLNVGRWDKIFSDIKVVKNHPDRVLADRASIGLGRPWMKAYALRLIQICHRRGAAAIGGMAAFTPGKSAELRQHQTSKVLADKQLENSMGHDGCWVSHPYFIGPALSAFPQEHQLGVLHEELDRYPDLLPAGTAPRTEEGLRINCRVGIAYLEGWSRGLGCVAWDNLMEDLATLEISRAQTWQWLRHAAELEDGRRVDAALVRRIFGEELEKILAELEADSGAGAAASFAAARAAAEEIFLAAELAPFLSVASDLA
jgi:malate synthase